MPYTSGNMFMYKYVVECIGRVPKNVLCYHRVGRVLSFFSKRLNWDLPTPHPQASVPAPPHRPGSGGRGTLAGEKGVGRVPIPTRRHTLWYSLRICTLCVPSLSIRILIFHPPFPVGEESATITSEAECFTCREPLP